MSINQTQYVDITSGVGGANIVPQRELIARVFNDNDRIPADNPLEFTSASDVATYFGSGSEEYKRAAFYFGFISKSIGTPGKISFGRWAKVAGRARIYGARVAATLAQFNAITAGGFALNIGAQTATLSTVNLSTAASLADVAAALQTAIRAAAGANFTTATVAYDVPSGSFVLGSSAVGDNTISINATTLSGLLGWAPGLGAIYSPGVAAQSLTAALVASADQSNNFGSFVFVPALSSAEVLEAATWNDARNVAFMFLARVLPADATTVSAATIGLSGTGLILAPFATEYDDMLPAAVLAATNYSRANVAQNYMYQPPNGLSAKVTTTALSDLYDSLRLNYVGVTQAAGSLISFFQRGVLTGGVVDPVDMNTYANEMWLKDAATTALLGLLVGAPNVPANATGVAMVLSILQQAIDAALFNGVISVGKVLSAQQRLAVTQASNDDLAYLDVQNQGYWVDAVVRSQVTTDGRTEYRIDYTLIYGKNDAVRKIDGVHVLI